MNETIIKFGYPDNLLGEFDYWVVLLRPVQVTAGSLVLACRESATSFSAISAEAGAELPAASGRLEAALARSFNFEKVNYLALMMVDKHVHYHVLPRYSAPRTVAGVTFTDTCWPGPPDIKLATEMNDEQFNELRELVRKNW